MSEHADSGAPSDPPSHRQRFDGLPKDAVDAIARLFNVSAAVEPYEPAPHQPVYAIHYRSPSGTLRLVCWPSLARLDLTCGPHAWIVKGIVETEVIDGLEAIVRSADGGMLFVALNGDVMMVGGGPKADA